MQAADMKEHALWGALDSSKATVDGFESGVGSTVKDRVVATRQYLRRFRSGSTADLFSEAMLNKMKSNIDQLNNQLASLPRNPTAQASAAMATMDTIVGLAAAWPQPFTNTRIGQTLESSLDDFRDSLTDEKSSLSQFARQIREEIETLSQEKQSLEKEIRQLELTVKSEGENLALRQEEHDQQFSAAQQDRTTAFDAALKSLEESIKSEASAVLDNARSRQSEAHAVHDQIVALRDEAEKVASEATAGILARDFGKYSIQQLTASVCSFIACGAFLFWAAKSVSDSLTSLTPNESPSWQWVALKLALTLSIIGGASVFLALGNKFLRNSTNSKRIELELRAIGPFLADLGDDARLESKMDFARRTFGHVWGDDSNSKEATDSQLSIDDVSKIKDIIVSVMQSSRSLQ